MIATSLAPIPFGAATAASFESEAACGTFMAKFPDAPSRFGAGPIEWLRERRLDLVRTRLLAARDGETVREIAIQCGMPRLATLIPEYTRRFGEKPSESLRLNGR